MDDAVKEGQLLAQLKHPYIVRYRESFTESGWLCILMDFCECGDLGKQIAEAKKRQQAIAEDRVLRWFVQAILALKYIHDKHILHRDLKPTNFFLAKNDSLKMGDFGIAKTLANTVAFARTQIGTPYYLSPELCQEQQYAWPSDVWAMGCILFEMCALKVPFDAQNIQSLAKKIIRAPAPTVPANYSTFVRQLCSQMLNKSPEARPSPEDILQRPDVRGIVRRMLDDAQCTPLAGSYEGNAGLYKLGDYVEYHSFAHRDWLPAKVINVDLEGRIVIDLKPHTWIPKEEQAIKVRPRKKPPGEQTPTKAPAASPQFFVYASPLRSKRSPRPPSREASPSPAAMCSPPAERPPSRSQLAVSPAERGSPQLVASPAERGNPHLLVSPADRCNPQLVVSPAERCHPQLFVSPAERCNPHLVVSPAERCSQQAAPISECDASPSPEPSSSPSRAETPPPRIMVRPPCGSPPMLVCSPSEESSRPRFYQRDEHLEYYSNSHKEWFPAIVLNVDADGRIQLNLKPKTWITREEQAVKVRTRRESDDMPSSRSASVRRSLSLEPAATPSRMASPSQARASSRDPAGRLASPRGKRPSGADGISVGTPRLRPPSIPPSGRPRVASSPLRCGGRNIAGI